MGLMRALQGVATGYLDARVGQFEAAAEAKRKEKELADKYKAEEAMRINIQNNERIENNKLLVAEKEAERERRKNDLLNLGFTDEFIAAHGQYALGSDQNFSNFIKLGQDQYGVARWWDTPINFGNTKGMTIQEHLMSSNTKTQTYFDGEAVKDETKNRTNIPDAVADNQLQGTYSEKTISTGPNLQGKNLFFASAKLARSPAKQYINKEGQIVTGFAYEQNIGEKDFDTNNIWTTQFLEVDDGLGNDDSITVEPRLVQINRNLFFELDSDQGKQIFNNTTEGLVKDSSVTSYQVFNKNDGKYYTIDGIRTEYTDGNIDERLTGIDPQLAQAFGIDLVQLKELNVAPGEAPMFSDEIESINSFNVDKNQFKVLLNASEGHENVTLNQTSGTGSSSTATANISEFSIPDNLSSSAKNILKQNAISLGGFEVGKNISQITGDVASGDARFDFIGKSDATVAAESLGAVIDSTLNYQQNLYTNYNKFQGTNKEGFFSQDIMEELGIYNNNPKSIQPEVLANKVARYYKDIRTGLAKMELSNLERFEDDQEQLERYYKSKGFTEEQFAGKSVSNMASDITDRMLQETQDLDSLISLGKNIKSQKEVFQTTQDSRAERAERKAVIKYFPPSEFGDGKGDINMFGEFIDNYVKDPNNTDQMNDLVFAIMNLTSSESEQQDLRAQARKYLESKDYPFSKDDTDFQTRKTERENVDKRESEQETGFATVEDWLNSEGNRVALPSEINLEDKGYDISNLQDYQIKNLQISEWQKENKEDYDIKTGLKMFVNPDLPIGHVEPLPKKYGFSLDKSKRGDWKRLWGDTHNPDGTPKNQSTKTEQKDKVTVLDNTAFNPEQVLQDRMDLQAGNMTALAYNKKYGEGTAESILEDN